MIEPMVNNSYEEPFPDEIQEEEVNIPYVNMINSNEKTIRQQKVSQLVPDHFQIQSLINLRRNRPEIKDSIFIGRRQQ